MHIKPGQQLSGLAEKQREKSCSFCWHLWFLPSLPSVRIHTIRSGFRGLTQNTPLCPALPSLRFGLCHPQPGACRYRTREPPHNINRARGACIWCASGQDPSVAPGDLQRAQRREQDNFYWNSSIGTIPSVYPNLTWGKYLLKHKSCLNLRVNLNSLHHTTWVMGCRPIISCSSSKPTLTNAFLAALLETSRYADVGASR